jgi:hypothetical protein
MWWCRGGNLEKFKSCEFSRAETTCPSSKVGWMHGEVLES